MRRYIILVLASLLLSYGAGAVVPHRANIPDVPGYMVLKGDFHTHTVFSDGSVWPTTRVDEAVYDGLDFISITDHMDTRLQKLSEKYGDAKKVNRNTSYQIAAKAGAGADLIVIHGGEITRGMHLFAGHFNTQFIKDGDAIAEAMEANNGKYSDKYVEEEKAITDGLKQARSQGAFLVWNHPCWERQAQNETKWWPMHTRLLEAGLMDGIEVVNAFMGFDNDAFRWGIEKNLTIVTGTDCHDPMFKIVDYEKGDFRPMTLVFATDRSEKGIREALDARRTAVFAYGSIYGREEQIKPLFEACFQISDIKYSEKKVTFKLKNTSSIPINLTKAPGSEKVVYPRIYRINGDEELTFTIYGLDNKAPLGVDEFDMNFYVQNWFTNVDTPLKVSYHFVVPEKYRKK